MTRLTKDMRESICRSAIAGSFKVERDASLAAEHALGIELYNEVFDKKTRDIVAKVPKGWFRWDACLRFNCGGYDLRFSVKEAVPVPSRDWSYARLGDVTGELAERAQAWANQDKDLKEKVAGAERRLAAMLDNITTIAALEKTWPEGKEYYARYLNIQKGASVPAVQVAEINSMLGIAEAA